MTELNTDTVLKSWSFLTMNNIGCVVCGRLTAALIKVNLDEWLEHRQHQERFGGTEASAAARNE